MVCTSVGISYIPEVDHKTNKQRYASCYSMILTDMTSWVTGKASFGTFCNGKGEDNIGMLFYMYWMRSHTFCKWRMEKTVLTCCLAGIRQDCIPPVSRWGRRWCEHTVWQMSDKITYKLQVCEDGISMTIHRYQMRSHTNCKWVKEKKASACCSAGVGPDHLHSGGGATGRWHQHAVLQLLDEITYSC